MEPSKVYFTNSNINLPQKLKKLMKAAGIEQIDFADKFTGTTASSVPFNPSAIITWQPVAKGLKPLTYAESIWSSAFFRPPT